jgi:hypothetical protein
MDLLNLLHPSLIPGHDAVVAPLLLVVLPKGHRLGHPKDMVLDLIQLVQLVHKVRADRAPIRAVQAQKEAQSMSLGDRRDVAVETALKRVCVSLRVGVKLTSRKGNRKIQFSRRRRCRRLDIRRRATTGSWETTYERRRVDVGGIRARRWQVDVGSVGARRRHAWMWPHNASVNMQAKCWPLRGCTQSRVREEDVAPEDRLKGEGESRRNGEPVEDSRCDGEPVGDSRRDGKPDHFIVSVR